MIAKEKGLLRPNVSWCDEEKNVRVDMQKINTFRPFSNGIVIFGAYFGDEGKGKMVDIMAQEYKEQNLKILSIRGQGSGNAGHTVVVEGKKYDFHYLTSAGLVADIMLLGPGMLIDPIRVGEEAKKLPKEKRGIIQIAERATIVTDLDRAMDEWCENQRVNSGKTAIGTTKSGVGPGAGNRGYRVHVTFADALACKDYKEFKQLLLNNPLYPKEVREVCTDEYAKKLWIAISELNIVNSEAVVQRCRYEGGWAVLLEVSQAVGLDPLFGNGGHFTTSTPCTDLGGVVGSGLTMKDFPDGTVMVAKAYGSKVGGGPYITKFSPEESHIADFIDNMVGEHGVTTGRKRDLGWFDAPAIRHTIALTGARVFVNCMDVITELPAVTDYVKVCFAYQNKETGQVTYDWPYHLDKYEPLYVTMSIKGLSKEEILNDYIHLIELLIGKMITGFGVGPSREGYRPRNYLLTNESM